MRRNEPAAVREIPETDFDLVIYEGRDRKTGRPYYHFKLVRTDGEKWFATCRPYHLFHLVKAIQFAAIGFSRVEAVGDVLVREQLAALALQLQSVSLPGDDNEEQKVNGLAGAFTRAD